MVTIRTAKKCDVNLKLSRVQYEMIFKILCAAQSSFDEADDHDKALGYEYVTNNSFLCTISKDEYNALQNFIKPID